jgi:hypothetical protein
MADSSQERHNSCRGISIILLGLLLVGMWLLMHHYW